MKNLKDFFIDMKKFQLRKVFSKIENNNYEIARLRDRLIKL